MIIAADNGVPENKLVNFHSEKKRHNGFSVPYDIAGIPSIYLGSY